jgi:cation:H+ antiporter
MNILPEILWINFLVLAASFTVLAKSADFLVDGAVGIAVRFNLPKMFIGIVLVGFATTAPEFVVSLMSAIRGLPEIALGNAIGSVVADDAFALSLAIIAAPVAIVVDSKLLKTTGFFLVGIDIYAFILSMNGEINRLEGLSLVALLVVYMFAVFRTQKKSKQSRSAADLEKYDHEVEEYNKEGTVGLQILRFAGGVAGVIIASEFLIDSSVNIAHHFGLSEVVIGLTIIAIGTSLPEIATCIVAAKKGHGDLALGDIIGADVLNILWIVGMASIANDITVDRSVIYFSFPAMIIVVVTMLLFSRMGLRLQKWKGIVLISMYVVYLILTFMLF